jgi:hypothetical protein
VTQAAKRATLSFDATSRQPTKLGSPEKRPRDRDELEEQAGIFGRDWRAGDRVMTWLNRREGRSGELSRLVDDGWSWADIGRAMHLAGITYRTGAPISAAILRKKASEARAAARAKSAPRQGKVLSDTGALEVPPVQQQVPPRPAPALVSLPPAKTDVPIEDEELEFKPATLIRHSARKPPEALPLPKKEPAPAPSPVIDVDAILARFTGRQ